MKQLKSVRSLPMTHLSPSLHFPEISHKHILATSTRGPLLGLQRMKQKLFTVFYSSSHCVVRSESSAVL